MHHQPCALAPGGVTQGDGPGVGRSAFPQLPQNENTFSMEGTDEFLFVLIKTLFF